MKIISAVLKILAALATVVGAIYLLATYGEQIVAWCKKVMNALPEVKCPCEAEAEAAEPAAEETPVVEEEPVEEIVEEEPVEAEEPVEEAAAEEAPADDVVADDSDFVG